MKLTGRKKEVGGQPIYEAEEVCGGNKGREKRKANEEKGNDKTPVKGKKSEPKFWISVGQDAKRKKKRQ